MTALKLTRSAIRRGDPPQGAPGEARVQKGDTLYAVETPDGLRLTTADAEFEAQMEVARRIMKKRPLSCATGEVTVWLSPRTRPCHPR